jgi:hypothetical protein
MIPHFQFQIPLILIGQGMANTTYVEPTFPVSLDPVTGQ